MNGRIPTESSPERRLAALLRTRLLIYFDAHRVPHPNTPDYADITQEIELHVRREILEGQIDCLRHLAEDVPSIAPWLRAQQQKLAAEVTPIVAEIVRRAKLPPPGRD